MLSIDITDTHVKLVRGSLMGTKVRVLETAVRELPRDAIANGFIADTPSVADAIIDIISQCGITEKEAVVNINSSLILYKDVTLPKIRNLRNTIALEAMVLSAMNSTGDTNISYSIIGETKGEKDEEGRKSPTMIKLNGVACPQRMVDGYKLLFTHVGLTLKEINVGNSSAVRLIKNSKIDLPMPLLSVHVENDSIDINLFDNNQAMLTRSTSIDSAEYSNAADYVSQAINRNIFHMYQFLGGQKAYPMFKSIMIYGDVKDDELISSLNSQYSVPVSFFEMPPNIFTFCDFDFQSFANSIGSFYKTDKVYDHLNLLDTAAVKEKERGSRFWLTVSMGVLITASAVFMATYAVELYNGSLLRQIDDIEEQMAAQQFAQRNDELINKIGILTNLETFNQNARDAEIIFRKMPTADTSVVSKLEELMPTGMRIDGEVSLNSYSVSASFVAASENQPSEYVVALLAQGYFKDISYNGFTAADGGYAFTLTMQIKGETVIANAD